MPSMPDAIILCGGAGLRLRAVIGSAPKAMADIAGRPFLELLFRQLSRYGFERAILAVGHQKDMIQSRFGDRAFGVNLAYSVESGPLGTGGALRKAAVLVESEHALVMNGDSYTDADLGRVVADYDEAKADACVVIAPADGRADCGSVLVDTNGRISSFKEKNGLVAAYLNAGIYMLSRQILHEIPEGLEVSLEQQLLPQWLGQGRHVRAFVCHRKCLDIGTPERYLTAQQALANVEAETSCSTYDPAFRANHTRRMKSDPTTGILRANLEGSLDVHRRLMDACLPALTAAADTMLVAYRTGHKALFFGNGGSAADAQHLAAEFVGRYLRKRKPLPALALNANTSAITAISNDYGYERVFARQLEGLASPGDVAVGISTSGKSPSVIEALICARHLGLRTIGLTGASGGVLRDLVDVLVAVPSEETPRIQECHILVGHALCDAVEQVLADRGVASQPL